MISPKLAVASLALTTLLVAADSSADGLPKPVGRTTLSFKQVTPAFAVYTGGPFTLQAMLEYTAAQHVVVKMTPQDGADVTVSADLAAPAPGKSLVQTISVTDPAGLPSCSAKEYTLTVSTADAPDAVRKIAVTPSCAFASKIVDSWDMANDDAVEKAQKGTVYLHDTKLDAAPTCGTGPTLRTHIINHTKISSPSVIVQLKDGDKVTAQTEAAFALEADGYKDLVIKPVGHPGNVPDSQSLVITDWLKKFGSAVDTHGVMVKTTRSCTLSVAPAGLKLAPATR